MARLLAWLLRPSLAKMAVSYLRLSARLLREPRVPWPTKVLPVGAVLYLLVPLDLAPDFLPVVGQLDDVALLGVALGLFVKWCPAPAVEFHRTAIRQGRPYSPMPPEADFIDAEFRHGDV